MTPFTDEDLKRLKEQTDEAVENRWNYPRWIQIQALLARLEAAEACIDDHRGDCLADIGKKCSCGYQEKLDAWRKAAGK